MTLELEHGDGESQDESRTYTHFEGKASSVSANGVQEFLIAAVRKNVG